MIALTPLVILPDLENLEGFLNHLARVDLPVYRSYYIFYQNCKRMRRNKTNFMLPFSARSNRSMSSVGRCQPWILRPRLVSHDIVSAGTASAVTEQSDLGATFLSASGAGVRWSLGLPRRYALSVWLSLPRLRSGFAFLPPGDVSGAYSAMRCGQLAAPPSFLCLRNLWMET